ncbi:MAG: hypothetical protein JXR65_09690 [Bacteroidales bacterium]|nr:hypothetical protein [Bacteroidales bacterium]
MKTLNFFGLLTLFILVGACHKNNATTEEQDAQVLKELYTEIQQMASSVSCEDAGEWNITAIGSKPCGGPAGYIAYSTQIDVALFLKKVETFGVLQKQFNEKWGKYSDCSIVPQPAGIVCQDGKPVFLRE